MYFPQSAACMAPNSANPPTQAEIMRVARSMGAMEGKVRRARQAYYCLFYRGDLNTNGWPLATQGGIPASTITGCPSPAASAVIPTPTGPSATAVAPSGVNLTGLQYWPIAATTEAEPVAVAPNSPTAYPQPPAPSFPPLTTQAHTAAAKALVAQAVASQAPPSPAAQPPTQPPTQPSSAQVATPITAAPVASPAPQVQTTPYWHPWGTYLGGSVSPAPTTPPGTIPAGMGDFDMCSFVTGLIASLGVAAAAIYLFRQAQKPGALDGLI